MLKSIFKTLIIIAITLVALFAVSFAAVFVTVGLSIDAPSVSTNYVPNL